MQLQRQQQKTVCVWNAFGQYHCGQSPASTVDAPFVSSTAGFASCVGDGEIRSMRPREVPPTGLATGAGAGAGTSCYTLEGFYTPVASSPLPNLAHAAKTAKPGHVEGFREGFCEGSCPAAF